MFRRTFTSSLLIGSLLGSPGLAQPFDEPDEILPVRRPVLVNDQPQSPADDRTSQAWADAQDAAEGQTAAPTRALPEGSFLIKQRGRVVRTKAGHRVFIPDMPHGDAHAPPMVLFPCQALWRLGALVDAEPDTPVVLSGQVTAYGGRNFMLPTAFARALPPPVASADPQLPRTKVTKPRPPLGADPAIADLIGELDRDPVLRGITPSGDDAGSKPKDKAHNRGKPDGLGRAWTDKPITPPVPDGSPLVRRRGRLARLPDGAWAVFFDNDQDTAGTTLDRPLTVLPCTLLASIEGQANRFGDSMELLISGRVFSYGQRSYLLPTIFQRPSKIGLDPVQ